MTDFPLSRYDVAESLRTPQDMALYLEVNISEVVGDPDATFLIHALGDVARSIGMTQLAKETGISRESLYQAIADEHNVDMKIIQRVSDMLASKQAAAAQG